MGFTGNKRNSDECQPPSSFQEGNKEDRLYFSSVRYIIFGPSGGELYQVGKWVNFNKTAFCAVEQASKAAARNKGPVCVGIVPRDNNLHPCYFAFVDNVSARAHAGTHTQARGGVNAAALKHWLCLHGVPVKHIWALQSPFKC